MNLRTLINSLLRHSGYELTKYSKSLYDQDGLRTLHNHDFMQDPVFNSAYNRGVKAEGRDSHWHWRVHVGLWASTHASKLQGDFVECGVNYGALSSAIMQYLNWDSLNKQFFLFDTFSGLDPNQVSETEKSTEKLDDNKKKLAAGLYTSNLELVKNNFSEWKNKELIQGTVPESLSLADIEKVAYLHLDMNIALPEVAAINYFWPKIVKSGVILLDDYAYNGYAPQKLAMDEFAKTAGISILSLPTGQGLIIK